MKESSSYANEVNGLINDVRIHVLNVQETIEALLAENMSSSGDIPQNLEVAQNPAFEVGSQAIIQAEHMGMKSMSGAVATIVGAYETTAYSVTYFPTTGEEPVKDHKWVIHEEINNAGEESLEAGTEVKLNADHMEGMDGASAVIEFALETTVYMVDFTTQTGEQVVNHKWLVESELAPVE
ncbi:YdhK family protein [Lysinibacillus fusiformis]|nr:YdhK family protein [Ureibacillus chungkukjangi]MCM3389302.1 YdhK family protein [Ureibacillus chungkukjangi]MDI7743513.1 YdhK family protein [Lysinibacillus fusiformis]